MALAAVLCATGCAQRPTTAASSNATATASASAPSARRLTAPRAAPRRTAVPRRITGPRSVNVPAAAATPARAPTRPMPPQILGASVSPAVVGSGTVVHATVRTTAGVVTVVAHAGGVAIAVPRVGPGLFAGSTTIPSLPPFVHGSYPVTFVARDASGASTQSAVGVSVR
ncbi:MAG TPA: hypothetical protein VN224_12365 [Xanthomonadales bacterium]|nr:hypothetical protein [Xanthomonadales bacterium]